MSTLEKIFDKLEKIETLISNKGVLPKSQMSRKEVCDEFSISLTTLHDLMKSGKLAFQKLGTKTLFDRKDVESFFNSLKSK
jgi:excisionase family DNA binding protein